MVPPVTRNHSLLPILLMGLAACTGPAVVPDVPVEEQSIPAPPGDRSIPGEVPPPAAGHVKNPAVVALLEDAEDLMQAGRHEMAAASLERALRIESKNARLWSRLAAVRFGQGSWQQARSLAQRSNSLSRGDRTLQLSNWRLIEEASRRLGDETAAEAARQAIRRLD